MRCDIIVTGDEAAESTHCPKGGLGIANLRSVWILGVLLLFNPDQVKSWMRHASWHKKIDGTAKIKQNSVPMWDTDME